MGINIATYSNAKNKNQVASFNGPHVDNNRYATCKVEHMCMYMYRYVYKSTH